MTALCDLCSITSQLIHQSDYSSAAIIGSMHFSASLGSPGCTLSPIKACCLCAGMMATSFFQACCGSQSPLSKVWQDPRGSHQLSRAPVLQWQYVGWIHCRQGRSRLSTIRRLCTGDPGILLLKFKILTKPVCHWESWPLNMDWHYEIPMRLVCANVTIHLPMATRS